MAEKNLTAQQIVNELSKSTHGDFNSYVPVGFAAARQDIDFFSHLIAWNDEKGQVRDSKIALPVISLATRPAADPFGEHAAASLAALDPRNFWRAVQFSRTVTPRVSNKLMRRLVQRYILDRELDLNHWNRTTLQFRKAFKQLYVWSHMVPGASKNSYENKVLFEEIYSDGSVFQKVAELGKMPASMAVETIERYKIPFLVALPAISGKLKDEGVALALIKSMSSTELVTNMKLFEKLGYKSSPVLRAALEEALAKAATESKKATLKTSVAASAVKDASLQKKLQGLQEKQLDNLKGAEGNWLVLGDRSGSMTSAIDLAKEVAGVLARSVKGAVHLVFFDDSPRYYDVTGKSLEQIKAITRTVHPGGSTSIGVGLQMIREKKIDVNGIAIISDGAENTSPRFTSVYEEYVKWVDHDVPVYFYRTNGESDVLTRLCQDRSIQLQSFDLRGSVDYYSLPNLVSTMKAGRYTLVEDIMETSLKKLDDVLKRTKDVGVFSNATAATPVGR